MGRRNNGKVKDEGYTKNADDVIKEEKRCINEESNSSSNEKKEYYGLALSGGGIRSASFGLGVMQGLVKGDALKKIDYLSTVSGGGYIGSALTWFLHKGEGKAGTDKSNFPLGVRVRDLTDEDEKKSEDKKKDEDKKKNDNLNFIRQHCNYLLPGKGLDMVSLFAVVIRTMFISLFVYLAMMTLVMAVLRQFNVFGSLNIKELFGVTFFKLEAINYPICAAIAIIMLLMLSCFLFSVRTVLAGRLTARKDKSTPYAWLVAGQIIIGWGWKIVFGLLLIGSLTYADDLPGKLWDTVAAGGSTIIGALIGFLKFRKGQAQDKSNDGFLKNLLIFAGISLLVYGLIFLAYTLGGWVDNFWSIIALALAAAFFGICVNLNYVGLHRMFRDRLMETFLPDEKSVEENKWGLATEADNTLLHAKCSSEDGSGLNMQRPYHLINTNMVLVDSPKSKYRGRGGDSFILSPLYCGSKATGWRQTSKYMTTKFARGMTLPTAMAISAAAVNPNAGVGGQGVTRNKLVSTLMSLLNVRTGYWAINPEKTPLLPFPPNFFYPGLKGVSGGGLSEERRSIELTDGGHFENLGLYELIRRKLSVIIVSDAGADPKFLFGDLANAIERVRVDFNTKIRFQDSEENLEGVLPGSEYGLLAVKYDLAKRMRYNLAKRGFAIADILYPDRPKGHLIYIKTTLTQGLPEDVYGYKSANQDFPDQSTADQFFDESQFEAYRELGYQLTWQMLNSEAVRNII